MRLQWLLLSGPTAIGTTFTTACTATAARAASACRPTSYASCLATCTHATSSGHACCLQQPVHWLYVRELDDDARLPPH